MTGVLSSWSHQNIYHNKSWKHLFYSALSKTLLNYKQGDSQVGGQEGTVEPPSPSPILEIILVVKISRNQNANAKFLKLPKLFINFFYAWPPRIIFADMYKFYALGYKIKKIKNYKFIKYYFIVSIFYEVYNVLIKWQKSQNKNWL